MIILILLLLLHSFGDPILPNVGNIQFGSAQSDNQYIPNPANPLTSRSDGFSYHLNTQYGLILHEQKTYKSLWNYEHTTRIFFRIPKPTKAYELAMSKSDRAFTKYQPRQHPYCQLNKDKNYKKFFTNHIQTLEKSWEDELELVQIDQSGRHRKQALLAAGLGALIGFYGISHYAHKKYDENFENRIQNEFTEFNHKYRTSEKRIMDVEVHNVNAIHEYFCGLVNQNYKVTSPKLADLAVDKYVNDLDHLLNNAINNRLPTSPSSLKALLTLCLQLNAASPLPISKLKGLCSHDIRAHLLPSFMGFELDGSSILMHFDVTLRSYSNVQIDSIYQVHNLGYINATSRYSLDLPPLIYKTNHGDFVQITDQLDSIHKPEPVSSITSTCAGSLITSNKQQFMTCLNDGLLRFIETPLTSCQYFEVGHSKYMISGRGRYTYNTDIRTITQNTIVPFGYFTCDIDNSKVSLIQLSQKPIEFTINQIDSRLLEKIPIEPVPTLIYPTIQPFELNEAPIKIHHINLFLILLLSLLFGALLVGMFKLRGNLSRLIKKTDNTNAPDNEPIRLTNNRTTKSLNDVSKAVSDSELETSAA